MKISERAQNMPQSPIRKLAKYADAAKRNGVKVYHLNIGQPDIATPTCALEAVKEFSPTVLSCGAVVKSVKTHIEDGFKLPPVEEFERQITPKTRVSP